MKFKLYMLLLGFAMAMPGMSFAGTVAAEKHEDAKPAIVHEKKPNSTVTSKVNQIGKNIQEEEKKLLDYLKRLSLRFEWGRRYYATMKGFKNRPNTNNFHVIGIGYSLMDRPIDIELKTEWDTNFMVKEGNNTLQAKLNVHTINMYYNFDLQKLINNSLIFDRVMPYVMGGAGIATYDKTMLTGSSGLLHTNSSHYKDSRKYAWNAGLGVKFKFVPEIFFDVGYRYLGLGEISTGDTKNPTSSVKGHQIVGAVIITLR